MMGPPKRSRTQARSSQVSPFGLGPRPRAGRGPVRRHARLVADRQQRPQRLLFPGRHRPRQQLSRYNRLRMSSSEA